jgi:hypothetical protein
MILSGLIALAAGIWLYHLGCKVSRLDTDEEPRAPASGAGVRRRLHWTSWKFSRNWEGTLETNTTRSLTDRRVSPLVLLWRFLRGYANWLRFHL